eukprot:6075997-Amphidinium_carterae.1
MDQTEKCLQHDGRCHSGSYTSRKLSSIGMLTTSIQCNTERWHQELEKRAPMDFSNVVSLQSVKATDAPQTEPGRAYRTSEQTRLKPWEVGHSTKVQR